MENFVFTVECKIERIVNFTDRTIDKIKVGDEVIGYIAVNKTGRETIITPLTPAGEFREAHCVACAGKELFSVWAGIPLDLVDMDTDDSSEPAISISVPTVSNKPGPDPQPH